MLQSHTDGPKNIQFPNIPFSLREKVLFFRIQQSAFYLTTYLVSENNYSKNLIMHMQYYKNNKEFPRSEKFKWIHREKHFPNLTKIIIAAYQKSTF